MSQRGGVKSVSILSVLGMAMALLASPAFVGSVAATGHDACDQKGAIAIDEMLLNPNWRSGGSAVKINLSQPILAGNYAATLVSYDDHSDSLVQPEEQWFAQLLDANGRETHDSGLRDIEGLRPASWPPSFWGDTSC